MATSRNRIGTYFLLGALAGFLVFSFQPWLPLGSVMLFKGLSLKRLIVAFFDAALVGALADWFAVTALFRDPLGLRLPHTNILAKNKDSIAEAVPRFLVGFVSNDRIAAELSRVDFSLKFEEALSTGRFKGDLRSLFQGRVSNWLASYSTGTGPRVESLRGFVAELCAFAAKNLDPAPAASELLRWAHRESFDDRVIEGLADLLRSEIGKNRIKLAAAITPIVKRNAGWKGLFIGRGTMEELIKGIEEELGVISADKNHELRQFLVSSIVHYADNLAADPTGPSPDRDRLTEGVRAALGDASFTKGLGDFVADLVSRLGLDLGSPESSFIEVLESLEDRLVEQLRADPDFRVRFNASVSSLIMGVVVSGHFVEGLSQYFSNLLRATDSKEFVGRIEDSVWNDLQYIRVNGAVVGGLVGLLLAIGSAFFPA
jgi:uncharacterized membrane-anchored protein YjiN (DUF445 family)